MSTSQNGVLGKGATSADCARLWATLTNEYIPNLQISIIPKLDGEGTGYTQLMVWDTGPAGPDLDVVINVWAEREFHNQLHLISMGQLFDLLIVAHRMINRYFELGEAYAPTRRKA